jgi:FkbM family methyltransferase
VRFLPSLPRLWSPCFVFRPDVFARACWRKLWARPERCVVRTAWGDCLEVEPRKFIGAHLYMRGVHELAVCEVLWRLAEAGETVVDAGAHIGVMTSLLSRKVGESGRILAFEPHPVVFGQLENNVRRWPARRVELFNQALSNQSGLVELFEGDAFGVNEGTASVEGASTGPAFAVPSVRLDEVTAAWASTAAKIDVEGHELQALKGAGSLLAKRRLRDVVFESTWNFPGTAHKLLQECGYRIFEIGQSLRGPGLLPAHARSGRPGRLADYLATVQDVRALELLAPSGWQVLCKS